MRPLLLLTLVVIGCAGATSRGTLSHHEVIVDPILDGWTPNYAYPFVEPPDLERPRRELERACRNGDPSACWKARLEPETAANCRRGHHMSCRALTVGDQIPDRLPGEHGRHGQRCRLDTLQECDLVALWAECTAEFTRSCREIRNVLDELGLSLLHNLLHERITALARSGCTQGIERDCGFLAAHGTADEALFADEMLCRYDTSSCATLARRVFLDGDSVRAHRLLEYACQRGIMADCERLAALYLRKELPEPRDGRGARLLDMACRFHIKQADAFKHAQNDYLRQCRERTGMWATYDRAFYAPLERVEPP
jgi:hypothetical protein